MVHATLRSPMSVALDNTSCSRSRTQVHVWLTRVHHDWLRDTAEAEVETVSSIIRRLVRAARLASADRTHGQR